MDNSNAGNPKYTPEQAEMLCNILLSAIWKGAQLNWDKTKLVFDDDYISRLVEVLFPDVYRSVFESLKAAEGEE